MPQRDIALLMDLYEITMAESYFRYKRETRATFDLFVRQLPDQRLYLVAAGLQDVLCYLKELRFSEEDIRYLKSLGFFSKEFLSYLKDFRFRGEVWAMPEGEVFFSEEPVIRMTGSIIETQLVESFLLNTVNLQVMLASKASRVVQAAGNRSVFDFSLRRTHGADAGIKAARSSYLAGFSGTSNVLAGKLYAIPVAGTMAHSFVMAFDKEIDSFNAYSAVFPGRTILLVDTYSTPEGIRNAVKTGLDLKQKGFKLVGIRLDSGDIVALSRMARKMFDESGLDFVKIFASGDLDEFRIRDIIQKGGCVDTFGVGTHMGVSIDAPSLDIIYKISEVSNDLGGFLPTMKLSMGKRTNPGRKQVFRARDKKGMYVKDVIALEKESVGGKPLLVKVMEKGKITRPVLSLERARSYLRGELVKFPRSLKKIDGRYRYPVEISPQLKKLTRVLTRRLAAAAAAGSER